MCEVECQLSIFISPQYRTVEKLLHGQFPTKDLHLGLAVGVAINDSCIFSSEPNQLAQISNRIIKKSYIS